MTRAALSPLTGGRLFSLLALLIGNLFPLVGVFLFGWSAFDILILYWAENVVIGLFVALKMATRLVAFRDFAAVVLIPFFAVHYGMFCFGHGLLLTSWFAPPQFRPPANVPELIDFLYPVLAAVQSVPGIEWSLLMLVATQAVSFIAIFLIGGECARTNAQRLMSSPYPRIVTLHIALLFGAVLARKFGEPTFAVALLVILKTAGEVLAFLRTPGPR